MGVGADQWDGKLAVDCKSVVDLSPLELVVPCRLVLEGRAIGSLGTDWKMERIHGSWEGIGGAKISALATGQWSKTGEWGVDLTLDPVDLAWCLFISTRRSCDFLDTEAPWPWSSKYPRP